MKSFRNEPAQNESSIKAANYGKHVGITEIFRISIIDKIDDTSRTKYELEISTKKVELQVNSFLSKLSKDMVGYCEILGLDSNFCYINRPFVYFFRFIVE